MVKIDIADKYIAGVGTRGFLKQPVINRQIELGRRMTEGGIQLLTGGAKQSDTNFLKGAMSVPDGGGTYDPIVVRPENTRYNAFRAVNTERNSYSTVYVQRKDLEVAKSAIFAANIFTPEQFESMDLICQGLHARNYYQIVHPITHNKVDAVFFAAVENSITGVAGGTRTAVYLARYFNIPTFNVKNDKEADAAFKLLEKLIDNP